MDKLFYLTSRYGNTGDNVMFHNKKGNGYGVNLDKLHIFTIKEAQSKLDNDIKTLPLLKSEVDKLAIKGVDHQYLDKTIDKNYDCFKQYVIQIERHYNGNDIGFVTGSVVTFNFSEAQLFSFKEAGIFVKEHNNTTMWAAEYLKTICRPTFQVQNINTRKMIPER